jgi:predicted hotdog family 3-hydroxylacyl-ACP dehydratase
MSDAHPLDDWLPHRGRMRLVDGVARCDADAIECTAVVRPDGVFAGADGMPAWIGVELMAQAAAAWAGAQARAAGGGGPRVGYLVSVRRYDAHVPVFAAGAVLAVRARCAQAGANGLRLFDCTIAQADRVLASGRIGVYEPPVGAQSP